MASAVSIRSSEVTPAAVPYRAFAASFTSTATQRAALAPGELLPINLRIEEIAATVLGARSSLARLREVVVVKLPGLDLGHFDALGRYAEALLRAHVDFLGAERPVDDLPSLVARASELRARLLADAAPLVKRGVLDGSRFAKLDRHTGALSVGSDLGAIAIVLRDEWEAIRGKCAIEDAEIEEAWRLSERIVMARVQRMQVPREAAADARRRAYTLLVTHYNEARRIAAFVRWEPRAVAKLLPSLWKGRGGPGKRKAHEPRSAQVPGSAHEPSLAHEPSSARAHEPALAHEPSWAHEPSSGREPGRVGVGDQSPSV